MITPLFHLFPIAALAAFCAVRHAACAGGHAERPFFVAVTTRERGSSPGRMFHPTFSLDQSQITRKRRALNAEELS